MYYPISIAEYEYYQVRPPRPHSAPSKLLSESETGESLCVNSIAVPQTPKTPKTPKTPGTPTETANAAAAADTKTMPTPTKMPGGKSRNNKRKVPKKQQQESSRAEQGSAEKTQKPGLLIVDGSSGSKTARKDTAGGSFNVESPDAGESQAAVKSESGQFEQKHACSKNS